MSRRRLLVLSSTGVGAACSADPMPLPVDAAADAGAERAADVASEPDEPFLGLMLCDVPM